ncbi:conserved hypothetical protein [Alteracholeplasma palmae J233]|uniref:Uncharacterized protein n=1 Tax=Alteracholeplasma palmae (strain ATCC 49389 / J233) TaxID=1318466 RepID=U4KN64_ALTPJ|nr:hypothetical protein [Alteracholeplasma palmae]CCV63610.1 conserved hypothetical protein [Alteracholeplasma palmae J233]
MKKFNLLEYTQEVIEKLDKENLYITHLTIAYKVVNYYNNNIDDVKKLSNATFNQIVEQVYEEYMDNDNRDILDEIIENILNKDESFS